MGIPQVEIARLSQNPVRVAQDRQHLIHRARRHLLLRGPPHPRALRVPRRVEPHDVRDVQADEAGAHPGGDRGVVRHPVPDRLHRGLAEREHAPRDRRAPVVRRAGKDRAEIGEEAGLVSCEERVRVFGRGQGVAIQEKLVHELCVGVRVRTDHTRAGDVSV